MIYINLVQVTKFIMILKIYDIPPSCNKIKVSFNNQKSWTTYDVTPPEVKILIHRYECEYLDEIYYKVGDKIYKPKIEDESFQFYFYIESNHTKYVDYSDLDDFLKKAEENTKDTPIEIHVVTRTIKSLEKINEIILKNKKYVNIAFTNLRHQDYDTSFLDNWDDPSIAGDVDSLKPFPAVFKNNVYLTGITIPKNDNYSQPNVLTGCNSLQDIKFENLKDWKVENEISYYNMGDKIIEGVENVDKDTFIEKLVDSDYTTNSYLMESENYW